MNNYIELHSRSLFKEKYMYIDTKAHLCDQLFREKRVRVFFKGDMQRDDSDYVVVICKIKKKDKSAFIEALEELPNKMMIMGHTDYYEVCKEIIDLLLHNVQPEKPLFFK